MSRNKIARASIPARRRHPILRQTLPAEFQARLNHEANTNRDLAKKLREMTQQLV
jgi:hypothetical protein